MGCTSEELSKLSGSPTFPSLFDTCFKENTDDAVEKYKSYKKYIDLKIIQDKYNEDYNKDIHEIIDENTTSKRNIEINYNYIKRREEKIKIFKYTFIAIVILSIIPLLSISKIGLIPKMLAFLIWMILMVIILIVVIFKMFIENRHRDDINFFEYNFEKPTNNEIARSKMQHELSKKDKDKCNALAELGDYLDPSNFSFTNDEMANYGLNSQDSSVTSKC